MQRSEITSPSPLGERGRRAGDKDARVRGRSLAYAESDKARRGCGAAVALLLRPGTRVHELRYITSFAFPEAACDALGANNATIRDHVPSIQHQPGRFRTHPTVLRGSRDTRAQLAPTRVPVRDAVSFTPLRRHGIFRGCVFARLRGVKVPCLHRIIKYAAMRTGMRVAGVCAQLFQQHHPVAVRVCANGATDGPTPRRSGFGRAGGTHASVRIAQVIAAPCLCCI